MGVLMDVCMYVCTYACMYVCMYVCMHACMYVLTNACTLTQKAVQGKLDQFMEGKELKFEGNSWDIYSHTQNRPIIAGVSELLKHHPQMLLVRDPFNVKRDPFYTAQGPRFHTHVMCTSGPAEFLILCLLTSSPSPLVFL